MRAAARKTDRKPPRAAPDRLCAGAESFAPLMFNGAAGDHHEMTNHDGERRLHDRIRSCESNSCARKIR